MPTETKITTDTARIVSASERSGIPAADLVAMCSLPRGEAIAAVMDRMDYGYVGGGRWQHDGHRGVVIVTSRWIERLREHESLAQVLDSYTAFDAVCLVAVRCAQNTAKCS